jgi:hypothetical protein
MKNDQLLTLKSLLPIIMTDIDMGILKESDQLTDIKNPLTASEVREQLKKTISEITRMLLELGVDIEKVIEYRFEFMAPEYQEYFLKQS